MITNKKTLTSLTIKLKYIFNNLGIKNVDINLMTTLANDIAVDLLMYHEIVTQRVLDILAGYSIDPKVIKMQFDAFVNQYREQFDVQKFTENRMIEKYLESSIIAENLKTDLKDKEIF